jgi:hypothetical protein
MLFVTPDCHAGCRSAEIELESTAKTVWLFRKGYVVASELNLRFSKIFESVCRNFKSCVFLGNNYLTDRCVNRSICCTRNGGGLFPDFVVSTAKPKISGHQFQSRNAMGPTLDQLMTSAVLTSRNETFWNWAKGYHPSATKGQFLPDSSGSFPWFR